MNNIVSIIHSLGINETLFVQMAIFIVVYSILKALVFKPYHRAHEKRQNATVGNTETADKLAQKAREVEARYQSKAREISDNVKAIYEKARLEATVEQDKILSLARENTQRIIEKARAHVQEETALAREALSRETPEIGAAIADRLLGPGGSAL